jgi:signal transduction histidine kinase
VWLSRRAERSERERQAAERQAADAVVAERRRLAAELHDGVIQDLSAVGYALHSVTRRLEAAGESELGETVDRTADIVRMDVMTLRGLMSAMYTADDESIDLGAAIHDLTSALGHHGVTARVEPLPALRGPVVSAVFQVARESLRNAVRHSGAPPHLSLACRGQRLTLTVSDAGSGYDPELVEGPEQGHLGLSLLRDAARRVGGRLETRTAPGEGTTVTLTVDLDRAPDASGDDAPTTPSGPGPSLSATVASPH